MKTVKYVSILIIAVIGGGSLIVSSMTELIPVGKVGVRIQQYSLFGNRGVVKKDFGAGWHRNLGPIDSWQIYDATVQTLEMTRDPRYGTSKSQDDVQVQSADGNSISIDVTIKYRIMPGEAHLLYQNVGEGRKYETIVRNEAQSACMGRFGQMKTEDFYDPEQKRKGAQEVKDQLAESLADNFIEVIDVLIRDVAFDPKYEMRIRSKKLADQEVELNKSMARSEEMSGKTQVIEAETKKLVDIIVKEKEVALIRMKAETDLEIAKIEAEYKRFATERMADADLIAARKDAEGQQLVKEAEAEGERLRNDAIQGAGGGVIVALEAARNLNLSEITVSTLDVDLLDLDQMAEKLGVPAKSGNK